MFSWVGSGSLDPCAVMLPHRPGVLCRGAQQGQSLPTSALTARLLLALEVTETGLPQLPRGPGHTGCLFLPPMALALGPQQTPMHCLLSFCFLVLGSSLLAHRLCLRAAGACFLTSLGTQACLPQVGKAPNYLAF